MDGTIATPNAGSYVLFNGAVPPNGFMVQIQQTGQITETYYVNDNGPAGPLSGGGVGGFLIGSIYVNIPLPIMFVTPPGYKPIGPVSVYCTGGTSLAARGW
jgi:hypothetical protein